MFGEKEKVKSEITSLQAESILKKLNELIDLVEDTQDAIALLAEKITKVEDSLETDTKKELAGVKGQVLEQAKFIQELVLKLIEKPREVIAGPYSNRYSNGYNKPANPNVAGPVGKLP